MNRPAKAILAFFAAILLSSCAINHNFVPRANSHPFEPIEQEFTSSKTFAFVNQQDDASDRQFYEAGPHRYHGNYNHWTDIAIEIVERELVARKASIAEDSDQIIELSVLDANYYRGKNRLTLWVRLSNGYKATYFGNSDESVSLARTINQSMMRAVVSMLNDPRVVEFLSD